MTKVPIENVPNLIQALWDLSKNAADRAAEARDRAVNATSPEMCEMWKWLAEFDQEAAGALADDAAELLRKFRDAGGDLQLLQ